MQPDLVFPSVHVRAHADDLVALLRTFQVDDQVGRRIARDHLDPTPAQPAPKRLAEFRRTADQMQRGLRDLGRDPLGVRQLKPASAEGEAEGRAQQDRSFTHRVPPR